MQDFNSRNWSRCTAAEIKSSFKKCCSVGSAEKDLTLELPKEMLGLFATPPEEDDISSLSKMEPRPGTRPQSMHFRSLNRWRYHLMYALHQLEWEVGTDPAQGVRKLGPYYGGEETWANVPWNHSPKSRQYIDIDYEDKLSKEQFKAGINTVPALSYKTNFSGRAKILLVFHPDRKVDVNVLESTLSNSINSRLTESFKSLNGHPVSEFPAEKVTVDEIPVVCNIYFNHGSYLKKPVHKDVIFGIGSEEGCE